MVWQMVHRTVTTNARKSKAVSGNRCINVQRVGLIHTRLILCLIHYFISRLDSKIICSNTILFPHAHTSDYFHRMLSLSWESYSHPMLAVDESDSPSSC